MLHHDWETVRDLPVMVRTTRQDDEVDEEEAESLRVWLKHHPDMVVTGLGKEVAEKLLRKFADRKVTPGEREELLALLESLVGQGPK